MTQLQILGLGLLVLAVVCAVVARPPGDVIRLRGTGLIFTRQSHPWIFEAHEKTLRTMTALCVILGIVFLLIRP